jgi:ATP-dependent helicase HrpA
MNQLEPSIAAFEAAGGGIPIDPEAPERLERVRWMLEELRVGLFAQELRTAETVSPQRIAKALVS